MFDGARFQQIYAEKNAENADARSSLSDLEILEKLIHVLASKTVKIFKSRSTSESPDISGPSSEHNMANKDKKSSPHWIPNNFEEIISKDPKSVRRERKDFIRI